MDRILLIDGTNNFLRNFAAVSVANANGEPVGGIHGFMNNIMWWTTQMVPSRIYVCWDGPDGSFKRRKILKEYKQQRKRMSRVNRNIEYTPDEIEQNRAYQFDTLKKFLEAIPVIQMEYEFVEADDIISVLWALNRDKQKIIISSDKDFYQLLDANTICYDPLKKEYINLLKAQEKFGVSIQNFALYKSIIGDKSDNVKGIVGVGPTTILKLLPFLSESKKYTVADVIIYAEEQIKNKSPMTKSYQKFVDQQDSFINCYNVVQLTDSIVPGNKIQIIKDDMTKRPVMEPIVLRILAGDDLQGIDIEKFITVMNGLQLASKSV